MMRFVIALRDCVTKVLGTPGILKRFIDCEDERKLIKSTQVGLYSLDLVSNICLNIQASTSRFIRKTVILPYRFVS